uniref:Uncharacterized protein n=1 Tax=Panagrolaimus superbus TaxID=310955 RepID=A0A914ZCY4_9BILA
MFWVYLILAFPVYYGLRYLWELIPVGNIKKRAVFISGCDTGFGRLLALKCTENGIPTFAGCYTKQGEENLKGDAKGFPGRLVTFPLDITKDESVEEAAKYVKKNLASDEMLWAVVNNAGVFSCYGPDAWTGIQDYKDAFEINCIGHIRCVHVRSRVSVPCGAPYAASKYAAEAWMDAIRQELRPYGIICCILEPEAFKTNLVDENAMIQRVNKAWSKLSEETKIAYGEDYKDYFVMKWNSFFHKTATPHLHYVVDNYYHAITAKFPRYRYRCGWLALCFYIPLTYLPTGLQDYIFNKAAGKVNLPDDLRNKTD